MCRNANIESGVLSVVTLWNLQSIFTALEMNPSHKSHHAAIWIIAVNCSLAIIEKQCYGCAKVFGFNLPRGGPLNGYLQALLCTSVVVSISMRLFLPLALLVLVYRCQLTSGDSNEAEGRVAALRGPLRPSIHCPCLRSFFTSNNIAAL